ncbi:MAG: flotillin family protein, partial [Desulfobacterales bacterium]|nr:flotillin family protein [Desulfobacterales bacterium]
LAKIEKDKAIEVEKKTIQDVIRERVMVEKTVIEEQERIKDTEAFATADREKRVSVTQAEKDAEQALVLDVKAAEASKKAAALKAEEDKFQTVTAAEAAKQAAELEAEERIIAAEATQSAAEKESAAKKMLSEAAAAEHAAPGLADARVIEAKNALIEQKGQAEANVLEVKFQAEAKGIEDKANAMKLLDAVGREHEEFKLELEKEREIEIAEIQNRKDIAKQQAEVLGQALKSARVDIVGGEATFFDKITHAVTGGKAVDRYVENSKVLKDVKETFFNSDPEYFQSKLKSFFSQFGMSPDDVKDLTVSAALTKLVTMSENPLERSGLYDLLSMAERSGMGSKLMDALKPKAE